jgi:hypothetical protein
MSTSRLLMLAVYPKARLRIYDQRGETARSQPRMHLAATPPRSNLLSRQHLTDPTSPENNERETKRPSPPVIVTTASSHIAIPMPKIQTRTCTHSSAAVLARLHRP